MLAPKSEDGEILVEKMDPKIQSTTMLVESLGETGSLEDRARTLSSLGLDEEDYEEDTNKAKRSKGFIKRFTLLQLFDFGICTISILILTAKLFITVVQITPKIWARLSFVRTTTTVSQAKLSFIKLSTNMQTGFHFMIITILSDLIKFNN